MHHTRSRRVFRLLGSFGIGSLTLAVAFASLSLLSAEEPLQGGEGEPPVITSFDWRDVGSGIELFGTVDDESPSTCAVYFGGGVEDTTSVGLGGKFYYFAPELTDSVVTAQAVDVDFNESEVESINVPL